jgi:hypothetical protein
MPARQGFNVITAQSVLMHNRTPDKDLYKGATLYDDVRAV